MQAGAASVEITPPAGTHLAGDGIGRHRPAEKVLDPLFARAVVLAAGGRKVCLLALDVTLITREWTDRIRGAAAGPCGLEPDAILVHATQTHSAPMVGHCMLDPDFPNLPAAIEYLRGGETAYYEFACAQAIEAIRRANAQLRPVQVGVGRAMRDGLAFNRRGILRRGGVTMPWFFASKDKPLGPTEILCLEGPTDPEVGVVGLRDDQARMVAMLLSFTCHPVNVFAQASTAVTADWPGAWAAEMQRRWGPDCVPVVLNGCCGNINPWPAFEPDFVPDHRRMGRALADSGSAVLERMTFAPSERLDWVCREVRLPLKPADAERVSWAEKLLAQHPQPLWSKQTPPAIAPQWFRAASIMSVEMLRRRTPAFPYEIQAFRIGDVGLVGLPGEPFVEGQLELKLRSPAPSTYVAHCATQYVGYIPTRRAFAYGGHEVDFSYWAKLAPEALDLIVAEATAMLRGLFG